jgi:hypothetical protein
MKNRMPVIPVKEMVADMEEWLDFLRPGKIVFTDGAIELEQEFKPAKENLLNAKS